jgi:glutamyl-Q tRNA(Asp) synthetase
VSTRPYRGRFAPTPSGPPHFGSLVAALASCLDARHQGGVWLLRIEDIDPPRVVAGATDAILRGLDAHGFEWDETVMHQSRRTEAYLAALADPRLRALTYVCACSRKQLVESTRRGIDGPVYPGTCRDLALPEHAGAVRVRVPERRIEFIDRQQGRVACDLARDCGDFVLRRADGVVAYHLGVVVDDAEQGITDIVRGADLLTSTPRHLFLQDVLGLPRPVYMHLPVVLDARGEKLSKQTLAAPLDARKPLNNLLDAAAFLGLKLDTTPGGIDEFWALAVSAWARRDPAPIRGRAGYA